MRQRWFSSIFFSCLLLISCEQEPVNTPIKKTPVVVTENSHIEVSPIQLDEALSIASRIHHQISDIFNFAYYYYGEEIEPVSLETFQDMQKRLSHYVTAHFLKQQLNTTIKEYCYFGCRQFR